MENPEILVLIVDVTKKILDNVLNINDDLINYIIRKIKARNNMYLPAI